MPQFSYTATKNDKTIHGTTEAASREAALSSLRKQNLVPLVIKQSNSAKGLADRFSFGKKVNVKELAIFTRQLSTLVSAGVPLNRSLSTLQSQTKSKYFQKVIASVAKDVEGGMPLTDAFAKFPDVFSDVFVSMVRAGESGGILDEILKRLSIQIEKDSSMRKKVKSAMAYPIVILSVTVIGFFGIMIFIIPKIGKIITDLSEGSAQLPVYTKVMLSISDFFISSSIISHFPLLNSVPVLNKIPNAAFMIALLFVASFFIRRYIKTPAGKYKFHALLLRLPIINAVITKVAIARFSRTFASLMSSGVGVLDALEVTGGAIGNKVIEKELKDAATAVRNGKQLSEPLSTSKHFPPIVSQMLAVGEESGKIDTILIKVADFYEEEVETTVDALSSIIEPVMIIILGAVVGIIAASVMGPIANLSKNVSNQ